jgi:hypothetical protein
MAEKPVTAKTVPVDLSHHYSKLAKNEQPSRIKDFYKYFSIPGIGNLAGGTGLAVIDERKPFTNTNRTT